MRGSASKYRVYHYQYSREHRSVHFNKMRLAALFITLVCAQITVWACDMGQTQIGCKIYGASCTCGTGCKTEYIYRTRKACLNALRDRSSNVCNRLPCLRGICIQTIQDPGFTCKCEGTGFYGQRCEKPCPTIPVRGMVFPHECIVI